MNQNKKYLILKGCAGLGNRLYTLCAAIEYSLRNDRILYVDWSDGQFDIAGENAFYKHFDLVDVPHLRDEQELRSIPRTELYPRSYDNILTSGIYKDYMQDTSNRLQRIPQRLIPRGGISKIYGYWRKKESKDQRLQQSDISSLRAITSKEHFIMGQFLPDQRKETLVVFADFCPPFDFSFFKKHVRLNQELQQELEDFVSRTDLTNAIGIHIRNTDKKPTSSFYTLQEKLKEFEFESIFLATDDAQLEAEITGWGYPVKSQEKFLPKGDKGLHRWALDQKRDDMKELMFKESIIDMYALSRCKILLRQGNSSFSKMADYMRMEKDSVDWQSL